MSKTEVFKRKEKIEQSLPSMLTEICGCFFFNIKYKYILVSQIFLPPEVTILRKELAIV